MRVSKLLLKLGDNEAHSVPLTQQNRLQHARPVAAKTATSKGHELTGSWNLALRRDSTMKGDSKYHHRQGSHFTAFKFEHNNSLSKQVILAILAKSWWKCPYATWKIMLIDRAEANTFTSCTGNTSTRRLYMVSSTYTFQVSRPLKEYFGS